MYKYDYLIVGSGFFGSICAYELNKVGKKVCVIESRNHIGGNCYTECRDGINIHKYGAHIFHTSNQMIWEWVNRFAKFNSYRHHVLANYNGEIYSLPFNMWTFNKLWGVVTPSEAKKIIDKQSNLITKEPKNLEEQSIKLVGREIYEKLIKGYTEKQWQRNANELPKEIIKRLPVRFNYDNNYFYDTYQGIPIGGYTQIFEKLLEGIEVRLNTNYFSSEIPEYVKLIYTGPIDKFFNYKYGALEYKTVRFDHKKMEYDNFQGWSVINYTNKDVPYTRIIEHKHFEFIDSPMTWITYEYPQEYHRDLTEPYYPVNDTKNNIMYRKYKKDADSLHNVFFGGRLGEYKYYDMHQVIERALDFIKQEIQ